MDTRAGTHMLCTGFPGVFMYLLILLSGDIETNPGGRDALSIEENITIIFSSVHEYIRETNRF